MEKREIDKYPELIELGDAEERLQLLKETVLLDMVMIYRADSNTFWGISETI